LAPIINSDGADQINTDGLQRCDEMMNGVGEGMGPDIFGKFA
jgi:hypothetical protein